VDYIKARSCDYGKDQQRLVDFLLAWRAASEVRLYPTIWRMRLLLSSRVWEPAKDARLWENARGAITGFAMLWRRQPTSPYLVLERFAHPSLATGELQHAMLAWGDQRGRDILAEQASPLTEYTSDYTRDTYSAQLLERFGFTRIAPNPDEHNVYFIRSLQDEIPPPSLPPGYTIRPLDERDDVKAYQSLYGFTKVNPQHQKELLESDEYCHLVVVNPQGDLVAYCECSVCRAEWHQTSQRIGWIEFVETNPEYKNKGLGLTALLAGLSRLRQWGADTAILITMNTNIPAASLYHKTGFEILEIAEYPSYEKKIELL